MNKLILMAMIALPMGLLGTGASYASDRAIISQIQGATPSLTNHHIAQAVKPVLSTRLQLRVNRQLLLKPPGSTERRPCPRRCAEELYLQGNVNPQLLSPSETLERKGPRGPGGYPALRIVPNR